MEVLRALDFLQGLRSTKVIAERFQSFFSLFYHKDLFQTKTLDFTINPWRTIKPFNTPFTRYRIRLVTTSSSSSLRSYLLSPLFSMTTCCSILQYYRKRKIPTCRGTIQFDSVTMRIRYRVNGV